MSTAARALLDAWEQQQSAYVAHREQRFEIMLELVALTQPEAPVVVDLASGPGSISERVLRRFPQATVVAVDHDPVLLGLAEAALAGDDARLTVVDADLDDPAWPDAVDVRGAHAVLSSTALHWLAPDALVRVYGQAAELLAPGGILLNGDHLRFDDRHPTLAAAADVHDRATQRAGFASGARTWEQWWEDAAAHPALGPFVAERERRFAARPAPPPTTPELHLAALRQAGFREAATVWQYLDDYVVAGVR
jgi:trans-aconitate methyltransferase